MESPIFRVSIRVHVQPDNNYGGAGLEVQQNIVVKADDFLSLCKILAQFQELAKKLELEHKV
jgi:hypothetical protein